MNQTAQNESINLPIPNPGERPAERVTHSATVVGVWVREANLKLLRIYKHRVRVLAVQTSYMLYKIRHQGGKLAITAPYRLVPGRR